MWGKTAKAVTHLLFFSFFYKKLNCSWKYGLTIHTEILQAFSLNLTWTSSKCLPFLVRVCLLGHMGQFPAAFSARCSLLPRVIWRRGDGQLSHPPLIGCGCVCVCIKCVRARQMIGVWEAINNAVRDDCTLIVFPLRRLSGGGCRQWTVIMVKCLQ